MWPRYKLNPHKQIDTLMMNCISRLKVILDLSKQTLRPETIIQAEKTKSKKVQHAEKCPNKISQSRKLFEVGVIAPNFSTCQSTCSPVLHSVV